MKRDMRGRRSFFFMGSKDEQSDKKYVIKWKDTPSMTDQKKADKSVEKGSSGAGTGSSQE